MILKVFSPLLKATKKKQRLKFATFVYMYIYILGFNCVAKHIEG